MHWKRWVNCSRLFNRSASTYDQYGWIQAIVGEELLTVIRELNVTPSKVLDIGSGTGAVTLQLARLYPHAVIFGCDTALAWAKRAEEKRQEMDLPALYFIAEMLKPSHTATTSLT